MRASQVNAAVILCGAFRLKAGSRALQMTVRAPSHLTLDRSGKEKGRAEELGEAVHGALKAQCTVSVMRRILRRRPRWKDEGGREGGRRRRHEHLDVAAVAGEVELRVHHARGGVGAAAVLREVRLVAALLGVLLASLGVSFCRQGETRRSGERALRVLHVSRSYFREEHGKRGIERS